MSYKPIPIAVAERILKEFDKDEVIIIAWEGKTGCTHITTAGTTMDHKRNAAKGGKALEAYLEKVGVIDPAGGKVFEDPYGLLEEGGNS